MRDALDDIKKIPHPEEAANGCLEGRTALIRLSVDSTIA
jgi:hypothetical protein